MNLWLKWYNILNSNPMLSVFFLTCVKYSIQFLHRCTTFLLQLKSARMLFEKLAVMRRNSILSIWEPSYLATCWGKCISKVDAQKGCAIRTPSRCFMFLLLNSSLWHSFSHSSMQWLTSSGCTGHLALLKIYSSARMWEGYEDSNKWRGWKDWIYIGRINDQIDRDRSKVRT